MWCATLTEAGNCFEGVVVNSLLGLLDSAGRDSCGGYWVSQ